MGAPAIMRGTCEGTAAAIYVCIGRSPCKVELYNVDDAGTLWPELVWVKGMDGVTAVAGGIKETGVTDSDRAVTTAANGVDEYAGGDELVYDGTTDNRWETTAGAAAAAVYVNKDGACVFSATDPVPEDGERRRTPAGFIIGADGDVNASAETIIWIAYFE